MKVLDNWLSPLLALHSTGREEEGQGSISRVSRAAQAKVNDNWEGPLLALQVDVEGGGEVAGLAAHLEVGTTCVVLC